MPISLDEARTRRQLWLNARDSIRHALDHFSELRGSKGEEAKHHSKWALLSVHHAAESFCNMLRLSLASQSRPVASAAETYFPSLAKSLELLAEPGWDDRLSLGERRLLFLLRELPKARNEIMHRGLPNEVEVSAAAISLLGILRITARRFGEDTSTTVEQHPRIEADVFSAIRYRRLEEYCAFAETLLREEYSPTDLEICPNCATQSVFHSHCEICFEEMDSVSCPHCGESNYVASWERHLNPKSEIECGHCGRRHAG
jgi:hypothetical protein